MYDWEESRQGTWRRSQKINTWCKQRMCIVALDSTVPQTKPLSDRLHNDSRYSSQSEWAGLSHFYSIYQNPTLSQGDTGPFFFVFASVNAVTLIGNNRDRLHVLRLTVQPCPAAAPQLVCSGQMSLVCRWTSPRGPAPLWTAGCCCSQRTPAPGQNQDNSAAEHPSISSSTTFLRSNVHLQMHLKRTEV